MKIARYIPLSYGGLASDEHKKRLQYDLKHGMFGLVNGKQFSGGTKMQNACDAVDNGAIEPSSLHAQSFPCPSSVVSPSEPRNGACDVRLVPFQLGSSAGSDAAIVVDFHLGMML